MARAKYFWERGTSVSSSIGPKVYASMRSVWVEVFGGNDASIPCIVCGELVGEQSGVNTRDKNANYVSMDHYNPEVRGFCTHAHNLWFLCGDCNSRKNKRPLIVWLTAPLECGGQNMDFHDAEILDNNVREYMALASVKVGCPIEPCEAFKAVDYRSGKVTGWRKQYAKDAVKTINHILTHAPGQSVDERRAYLLSLPYVDMDTYRAAIVARKAEIIAGIKAEMDAEMTRHNAAMLALESRMAEAVSA